MKKIPKIIHYCWFGGKPLSNIAQKCISSWKKYCPDYEVREWNEKNFNINENLYVKEAYMMGKWAFITDYVRLYAIYNFGGIYMDTDVEMIKNIDRFLINESFSGFEDGINIPTAIMGAEKNNEWIGYLLSYYNDKHFVLKSGRCDLTTNVTIITSMTKEKYKIRLDNTLQKTNTGLVLYPKDYFCPKDYWSGKIKCTENTYVIHHFNGSWQDDEIKAFAGKRNRLCQIFGNSIGAKISGWIITYKKIGLKDAVWRFLMKRLKK